MGIIGSLVGGAVSAAGSIFGGVSASKAMKRVKKNIETQRRLNQDWYDRRYYENATQRLDAQALLNKTEEAIRNRDRQAAGIQAVTGGTEESLAAAKAANNEALAQTATNIAVNSEARKDQIEQQYQANERDSVNQLNDVERQKAGNIKQAVGGVAQAAAGMGQAF